MKTWRLIILFSLFLGITLLFLRTQPVFAKEIELPLAYPGAEAREKIPYQNIWNDEPEPQICLTMRYDTDSPAETVAKWYYEKLTQAGWQYQGTFDEKESIHFFDKDDRKVKVIIKPGGPNIIGIKPGGCLIHFSWQGGKEKIIPQINQALLETETIPLYPGATRFYRKEVIILNKVIGGWPDALCVWKAFRADAGQETVAKWYYDALTSAGWQSGKALNNYGWEPQGYTNIGNYDYLKGNQIIEINFNAYYEPTSFNFCFTRTNWGKSALPSASSTVPEEEVSELQKQIAKDLFTENPDLPTLFRLYYFYRYSYNDRAGVAALPWLLEATILEPLAALVNLKNTVSFYKLKNSWQGFFETVVQAGKLILRGDVADAFVLVALNMPDEKFPIPFASLFLGISKTEYFRWQAGSLYKEVLAKLKEEDSGYCVLAEKYKDKDYCYKSWLEYRNAFQPEESLFFPGKLPRSAEETEKAYQLWQEKTKSGEFSDGIKYTVKEMAGEDWQNAFEDVSWPKRRPGEE